MEPGDQSTSSQSQPANFFAASFSKMHPSIWD